MIHGQRNGAVDQANESIMDTTIKTPKTYKEALESGYKCGRTTKERGYISRKSNPDNHAVQVSGTKELYVSLANWKSTRYCFRQYLIAP